MAEFKRTIAVAVDGSENALKSLDYLSLLYGPEHKVEVTLLYVLPVLPMILVADPNRQTRSKVLNIEKKGIRFAEDILAEARSTLVKKGFNENCIEAVYRKKQMGIPQDICTFAAEKQADALLITMRGRSRLEALFTGEICNKVLAYCLACPLWIVEGDVHSNRVLLAMDRSENALRAVEHAGKMLAGENCQVTLFHSKRHLRRFVPQEVLGETPELEELWRHQAAELVAPYMKKAKEMLLAAGFNEAQILTKVVDGSRSAASDILKEARGSGCGTIVLGRHGRSGLKEFFMGSITSKVLQDCAGMAVWVVD